jgi:hypothetical protein
MGVPLLFSLGATQPRVTAELEVVVLVGGGVVVVAGGAVVVELPLVVVVEPVSATVCGGVELVVLVLLVVDPLVVDPAADDPDSSPPHPPSASARLPIIATQTIRLAPNPRTAFRMQPPKMTSNAGRAGHEVTINRLHERAAQLQLAVTHEADAFAPATPLS